MTINRPNAKTLAAIKEAREGNLKTYSDVQEMLDDILNDENLSAYEQSLRDIDEGRVNSYASANEFFAKHANTTYYHLDRSFAEFKQMQEGKIKGIPAEELLNELN